MDYLASFQQFSARILFCGTSRRGVDISQRVSPIGAFPAGNLEKKYV